MRVRRLVFGLILLTLCVSASNSLWAWGKGHRLIRLWAVARLPEWQTELIGQENLARLCRDYTSLQDKHAGGKAPQLDPYCLVPGVRLSLHDVNPPMQSATAIQWYLEQIANNLQAGKTDEAMKFLGVLCHWNEDPGCPSAHSSPVSELQLKTLIPPPKDKARLNYLFGAGGFMDSGDYQLADEKYTPRLLGRTRSEAALRIYEHQKLLRHHAAAHIIPIVQDTMQGDGTKADEHRAAAALANGRHTADVIFTAICLATDHSEDQEFLFEGQPLTDWLPDFRGRMIPHPYYVKPFLVNQAMDAKRRLHPLKIGATEYETGYGMGTPFELDFVLAPGNVFSRFTCDVGLHPTAGKKGAVQFAVVANGKELVRTKPVRVGDAPVKLDIPLPQADVLKLTLQTIAGEGSEPSHNLAVWGTPTLKAK
ncbi:NPCBM/NEW2 domain protein [Gimesia alba]|uniref:NPCBM/NEW2 domain protein n=1 Tax=Gimesia alba TaxID=2527973 RepID=A0A517RMF6_9PLAN|nr:NPCBM/NEW2 domain-containing protein [Gimesia alba]QDT44982.1 NPCBM/NEW2 domain protein [Gimesia alba]